MKVNPGGIVAPSDALGRDALIKRLWKRLEKQGLILSAERRMGKTTILKKMAAEPKPGFRLIYHDLERCADTADFASRVTSDVDACLTRGQSTKEALRNFWREIGGTEVGGVLRLPQSQSARWGDVLERGFALLSESLKSKPDEFTVLAWDEFPLMLKKIASREGATHAMDVLDRLRALRNSHPQIRLIFTGSIGLHHVISNLREQDYPNSPKNDMYTVEIPPLARKDAVELAKRLIQGEQLGDDPNDACAQAIADSVDCFAFYIHHLVDAMVDQDLAPTPETAHELVDVAIIDPVDRWELRNYRERLDSYYGALAGVASLTLDLIAEQQPVALEELLTKLRLRGTNRLNAAGRAMLEEGEDGLRKLLWRLLQDHYLLREADGGYRFRFEVIRRWWLLK